MLDVGVVALTGQYQQVVSGVVGGVSVTVMDDLSRLQRTPETRGCELTVIEQSAPCFPVPDLQVLLAPHLPLHGAG